jgi:hypothetical protein
MGWSESYWEDVRADWARLQIERGAASEDDARDEPNFSRPEDPLVAEAAVTDLARGTGAS